MERADVFRSLLHDLKKRRVHRIAGGKNLFRRHFERSAFRHAVKGGAITQDGRIAFLPHSGKDLRNGAGYIRSIRFARKRCLFAERSIIENPYHVKNLISAR